MKRAITSVLIAVFMLGCLTLMRALAANEAPQGWDPLLASLPESDAVITVNVPQISSQLQTLLATKPQAAAEVQKQIERLFNETGIDLNQVDKAAVALTLSGGANRSEPVVLATGRFNETQVLERVRQSSRKPWSSENYNGQKVHTEGATTGRNTPDAFSFLDQNTLVFGTPSSVRRTIDVRRGSVSNATQNPKLMEAWAQTNAAAPIRFALTLPNSFKQQISGASGLEGILKPFAAVNQVAGTVDLGSGNLEAKIALLTSTEDEASQVSGLITTVLGFVQIGFAGQGGGDKLGEVLKSVSSTHSGNAANLTVTLNAELLSGLIDQIDGKKIGK